MTQALPPTSTPSPLDLSALGAPFKAGRRLHASAVSLAAGGVLILGPSGAGKSTLALGLMALGADLIGDDAVTLLPDGADWQLSPASDAPPLIEARGIGLLPAGPEALPAPLVLVVDLGQAEALRLPPLRHAALGGRKFPLILGPYQPSMVFAVMQILRCGPPVGSSPPLSQGRAHG